MATEVEAAAKAQAVGAQQVGAAAAKAQAVGAQQVGAAAAKAQAVGAQQVGAAAAKAQAGPMPGAVGQQAAVKAGVPTAWARPSAL